MMQSADDILAIPADQPERLFSSADTYLEEHRSLALHWHPDRNKDPRAGAVIAHINALKDTASKKVKARTWEHPGVLILDFKDGRRAIFRHGRKIKFELGTMYYSRQHVMFVIGSGFKDLVDQTRSMLSNLKFRNPEMAAEMKKYLPQEKHFSELEDGSFAIRMAKTDDVFLLNDVRAAQVVMDPKHVAWVMSGVYNIACYLEYAGIVHNGITPKTVFISPKFHSALLLGGWWYSVHAGERLKAMPDFSRQVTPPDVLSSKKADSRTDLFSIKALGRDLLGDQTGMTLLQAKVPEPMVTFLRQPSSGSAREDYASWMRCLEASFGPRRFTEMVIHENDIFKL